MSEFRLFFPVPSSSSFSSSSFSSSSSSSSSSSFSSSSSSSSSCDVPLRVPFLDPYGRIERRSDVYVVPLLSDDDLPTLSTTSSSSSSTTCSSMDATLSPLIHSVYASFGLKLRGLSVPSSSSSSSSSSSCQLELKLRRHIVINNKICSDDDDDDDDEHEHEVSGALKSVEHGRDKVADDKSSNKRVAVACPSYLSIEHWKKVIKTSFTLHFDTLSPSFSLSSFSSSSSSSSSLSSSSSSSSSRLNSENVRQPLLSSIQTMLQREFEKSKIGSGSEKSDEVMAWQQSLRSLTRSTMTTCSSTSSSSSSSSSSSGLVLVMVKKQRQIDQGGIERVIVDVMLDGVGLVGSCSLSGCMCRSGRWYSVACEGDDDEVRRSMQKAIHTAGQYARSSSSSSSSSSSLSSSLPLVLSCGYPGWLVYLVNSHLRIHSIAHALHCY